MTILLIALAFVVGVGFGIGGALALRLLDRRDDPPAAVPVFQAITTTAMPMPVRPVVPPGTPCRLWTAYFKDGRKERLHEHCTPQRGGWTKAKALALPDVAAVTETVHWLKA